MPNGQQLITEIARTLASLFRSETQAQILLQDAGVSRDDLIPWSPIATRDNWINSLTSVEAGVIAPEKLKHRPLPDGLLAILLEALNRYPGNRDLPGLIENWEDYLAESGSLVPARRFKVLFLAANPVDTDLLRIGYEFRALQERLSVPELPVRIDLLPVLATEPKHLGKDLMREQPTVVHFAGHGESDGCILLEGPDGNKVRIPAELLGEVFRAINYPLPSRKVRCVVLNACHSEAAAQAISKSVDVVIGTREAIADDASVAFSREFYGGLAHRRPVGNAIDLGRTQMQIEAEERGATRGSSDARFYDPDLVVVHRMKRVNLARLILGGDNTPGS
jgi:hypothetical protein